MEDRGDDRGGKDGRRGCGKGGRRRASMEDAKEVTAAGGEDSAVATARKYVEAMLRVNSNRKGGGGTQLFHDSLAYLKRVVAALPDAAMKQRCRILINAMEAKFDCKTVGTWKRFLLPILRALGVEDGTIADARRTAYLKHVDIDAAEEFAVHLATASGMPRAHNVLDVDDVIESEGGAGSLASRPQPRHSVKRPVEDQAVEPRADGHAAEATEDIVAQGAIVPAVKRRSQAQKSTPPPIVSTIAPRGKSRPQQQTIMSLFKRQQGIKQELQSDGRPTKPEGAEPARPSKRPKKEPKESPESSAEPQAEPRAETQAETPAETPFCSDPLGYYAALGLRPGATVGEIRASYRRRALATHPDKPGGSREAFAIVQNAFEFLADSERRMQYGGCSWTAETRGGSQGGVAATRSPGRGVDEEARLVCATLLTAPRELWTKHLAALSPEALEAVRTMLKVAQPAAAKEEQPLARYDYEFDQTVGICRKLRGITGSNRCGFHVKAGWRNFYVKSAVPVRTVEQAVNLHIAFMQLKDIAMARHSRFLKGLKRVGCIGSADGDDDSPPLLQSELLEVMLEEPFVQVQFSSDLSCKRRRVMSPFTPNLESALTFRAWLRRTLSKDYERVLGTDHITEVKGMMLAQAQKDREEWPQAGLDVLHAVEAEVARREQRGPPEASLGTQKALELCAEYSEALRECRVAAETERASLLGRLHEVDQRTRVAEEECARVRDERRHAAALEADQKSKVAEAEGELEREKQRHAAAMEERLIVESRTSEALHTEIAELKEQLENERGRSAAKEAQILQMAQADRRNGTFSFVRTHEDQHEREMRQVLQSGVAATRAARESEAKGSRSERMTAGQVRKSSLEAAKRLFRGDTSSSDFACAC